MDASRKRSGNVFANVVCTIEDSAITTKPETEDTKEAELDGSLGRADGQLDKA